MENIRQWLDSIYEQSPSWMTPPELEVGDFVVSRVLGEKLVVKGYVWENDGWAYFVKHNGLLKKHLIHQLIVLGTKTFIVKNRHALGDVIECKRKGFTATVRGVLFDSWWKYGVLDANGDVIWIWEVEACKSK